MSNLGLDIDINNKLDEARWMLVKKIEDQSVVERLMIDITIATTLVLVTSLSTQYLVAQGKLRPAYWIMIVNGCALTYMNTRLAFAGQGQGSVAMLNISAVWRAIMGIKGLRRVGLRE